MALLTSAQPIRVARPSRCLRDAERFWVDGVGLDVLWRTGDQAQGGHALLMVGLPGGMWHLELVEDPDSLAANPPGEEDLLVVYRGSPITSEELDGLVDAGGRRIPARNPYWDEYGVTILDPDGYRLVLSHRTWGSSQ